MGPKGGYFKKGMVVTVEPGIYFPDWEDRLENLVVVQEEGNKILFSSITLKGGQSA